MAYHPIPRPEKNNQWEGLTVRSVEPIKIGDVTFPIGSVFAVIKSWRGLDLTISPCKKCGITYTLRRVDHNDVEPVAWRTRKANNYKSKKQLVAQEA